MKNIHVLHILNSAHGGSAISTFQLIDELNKQGVRSSLVCFNNANIEQREYITRLVDGRVMFIPLYWMNKRIRATIWKRPLIELKSLLETWRGYKFQNRIQKLIRRYGINLIHTGTSVNPEGAIAAKRSKLPHIWHMRELIGPNKHFQFYNYKRWSAYVSNHCDVILANSRVTRDCLQEYFETSIITTIPNAIDVELFSKKQHINRDTLVVGMVANLNSRWKNHQFFLETAALSELRNIEFRIYGAIPPEDDVYYKHLRDYINRNGLSNVRFMGFFEDPATIMQQIDILFHPTDLESFGRIFIEAMAGGIPVIAINQGGALEMVRHNETGFLIPLNDKQAAAREILKLKDPTLRNVMGTEARILVESEYSLSVLANRIITLYKKLLV